MIDLWVNSITNLLLGSLHSVSLWSKCKINCIRFVGRQSCTWGVFVFILECLWCLRWLTSCQVTSCTLLWLAGGDRCWLADGLRADKGADMREIWLGDNRRSPGGSGLSDFFISITVMIKMSNQLWLDLSTCHSIQHITRERLIIFFLYFSCCCVNLLQDRF